MTRYWRQSKRIAGDARSIPLHGDPDRGDGRDANRYYRCWNCGFICDVERDSQIGHPSGEDYLESIQASDPNANSARNEPNLSMLEDSLENCQIGLKLTQDGTAETVAHTFESVIKAGCPLCGTTSWKGGK